MFSLPMGEREGNINKITLPLRSSATHLLKGEKTSIIDLIMIRIQKLSFSRLLQLL